MADFEYFRAEESDQFSFFRIQKALFTEKEFASLSTDAKLLYGILLDRISLSKKNGWIDGDGYVYIIYTIAELQELLRMLQQTDAQESEVRTFIREIRQYATIQELDETVLNRLINRILVGEVKKVDGQKTQEIRIVYNFVGEIVEMFVA